MINLAAVSIRKRYFMDWLSIIPPIVAVVVVHFRFIFVFRQEISARRNRASQNGAERRMMTLRGAGIVASIIVVLANHNVCAAQGLAILPPPFSGAARVAGGREAFRAKRLYVLLALADEDFPGGRQQLRQPVGNALHGAKLPGPSAPIRPALQKLLAETQ